MASQDSPLIEASSRPKWFVAVAALAALVGLAGGFVGWDAVNGIAPNSTTAAAGFGTLAGAILLVLAARHLSTRRLVIDIDGIEVRGTLGKSVRIHWSEPHDFFYLSITETAVPVVEKASVRASDGRCIDVDNVEVPGKANAAVPKVAEQYSTAANWPKIRARIEAGEEVSFGPVSMSKESIRIGDATHSLERRVTLQMNQGKVKVGTEGKWRMSDVLVRDVANYPSLLKAIGQVSQALPPG